MAIDKQQVEVALKLRLESNFKKSLKNIYSQIIQESTEYYENTGQANDLSVFFNSLSAVTFLHWMLTRMSFDNLTFKMLKNSKSFMRLMEQVSKVDATGRTTSENVLNGIKQQSNANNTAHMNDWVNQATISVNNTNQKQLVDIVALGLTVNEFRKKLRETYNKRIGTIASTTVQESAESTKDNIFTESNNVIKANIPNAKPLRKQWIAVLDDRTRPDHAAADMQIKEMN